jgi:hypothetical protein
MIFRIVPRASSNENLIAAKRKKKKEEKIHDWFHYWRMMNWLPFWNTRVHPGFLVVLNLKFPASDFRTIVFFGITLFFLLRFTASHYTFDIFKLFLRPAMYTLLFIIDKLL